MDTIASMDSLRVLNQTGARAHLRFRCGGLPAWSLWLDAGGSIGVPAPAHGAIQATTSYADRHTGVAYSTPSTLGSAPASLIAAVRCTADGLAFEVEVQPFDRPGATGLMNLTAADVHWTLSFTGTPFRLNVLVPAQTDRVVDHGAMDLSVTVDGISTPALPIAQWSGEIAIHHADAAGQRLPTLVAAPNARYRK